MLTVSHSTFSHNLARGGHRGSNVFGPGFGQGGGILNVGAISALTVRLSTFTANQAVGGAGDAGVSGGNGVGGAILTGGNATASVSHSTFSDNQAVGGAGGSGGVGGTAGGGGINNTFGTSRLFVTHSTFTHNQAIGGAGGTRAAGGLGHAGALENGSGLSAGETTLSVRDSTLTNNLAVGGAAGAGGTGGNGAGGGVENLTSGGFPAGGTVSNCHITGNQAVGGTGSPGGVGEGAGISNRGTAVLTVTGSTVTGNQALGGAASDSGNGGDGLGGGIYNEAGGTLDATGSTISGNQALGGAGNSAGKGIGGGLYLADGRKVSVKDTTIQDNHASTSDDDVFEAQPGPATHFGISAPAHVTSGMAFDVTVTALDAFDHTAVRYRGTVTFSSGDTDPGAVLPADYTFTTADRGVHAFPGGFTLVTAGDQMLTAADTSDSTITSRAIVTVDPGPAAPPGGCARDQEKPAPFFGRYTLADSVLIENRSTAGAGGSDGQHVGRGRSIKDTAIEDNHASTSNDDVFGDCPP